MTLQNGPTLSSSGLEPRRKKMLFRAWHRGMKEMDIVFGKFADAHLATLSEIELTEFEHLLKAPDRDLFKWISGEENIPIEYNNNLMKKIIAFHTF